MRQFAVIGLGRFGANLAKTLSERGYEVLAIDYDQEKVNAIMNDVTHAVQADAMEEESLRSLGLRNFDTVVVAIGEHDIQANILVTVMLKELGVKQVIARAQSELHGKVLAKVGVDRIIFPEVDMGVRLAQSITSRYVLDFLELTPEYSILEIIAPASFLGKSLRELDLKRQLGITILAIKRDKEIMLAPRPELPIYSGDILVALGTKKALKEMQKVRW